MKILLGITSSIAAYKACDIVSGLIKSGNEVFIVMTKNSLRFCPIEVLSVLSSNPVYVEAPINDGQVHHIDLVKWADILVIVPATYNSIGKINSYIADNLLTEICSVAESQSIPKLIFPAMNPNMFKTLQPVLNNLSDRGWQIQNPINGLLACGDKGLGKLDKPRNIISIINSYKAQI